LQAGDTVFIREGTYNNRIEPVNSGTPGNYITYMAYSGETPVIDRSVLITNWTNYTGSIYWAEYTGYTIPYGRILLRKRVSIVAFGLFFPYPILMNQISFFMMKLTSGFMSVPQPVTIRIIIQ